LPFKGGDKTAEAALGGSRPSSRGIDNDQDMPPHHPAFARGRRGRLC